MGGEGGELPGVSQHGEEALRGAGGSPPARLPRPPPAPGVTSAGPPPAGSSRAPTAASPGAPRSPLRAPSSPRCRLPRVPPARPQPPTGGQRRPPPAASASARRNPARPRPPAEGGAVAAAAAGAGPGGGSRSRGCRGRSRGEGACGGTTNPSVPRGGQLSRDRRRDLVSSRPSARRKSRRESRFRAWRVAERRRLRGGGDGRDRARDRLAQHQLPPEARQPDVSAGRPPAGRGDRGSPLARPGPPGSPCPR